MSDGTTSQARYRGGAILLHWLIAAAILFEIGLGWRMEGPPATTYPVFQLHKSVGITILLLTLIRIAWRLTHRPPPFPSTLHGWERALAHATHIGFYVLLLGLPLTGWLMVSSSKLGIPTVLYGAIPWPHVPGIATLAPAAKAQVNDAADFGHHAFILATYVLLALHVAGPLKHQFVDRGRDLARMLPARAGGLGIWLAAIVAGAATAFLLGNQLPLGARAPQSADTAANEPPPAPPPPPAEPVIANETTAAPPVEEETPAAPTEPSDWTVNTAASSVKFGTRWSGGTVAGSFAKWRADIRFDPALLDKSRVSVTIDMASVRTGDSDSSGALPGDDWFAVAAHPQARFVASRFRKLTGDRYEARGTLTLRGVSKPYALPFTLKIAGDIATMRATVPLDRTLFGVGQGEWSATNDIPAIVTLDITVKATR